MSYTTAPATTIITNITIIMFDLYSKIFVSESFYVWITFDALQCVFAIKLLITYLLQYDFPFS